MVSLSEGETRTALEEALVRLTALGRENTADAIRPIVIENMTRGRDCGQAPNNPSADPKQSLWGYVVRVADFYEALNRRPEKNGG